MAKKVFIYYLFPYLLCSCLGDITHVTKEVDQYIVERNNSMELIEFLDIFTNGNSWQSGANDIRINWLSNVDMGPTGVPQYINAYFTRKGTIHITLDGKFSDFYMRERQKPVPWSINMYGARTLYTNCILKSDTTGGDPIILEEYLLNKKVLITKFCFSYKRPNSTYGYNQYRLYQIKLPSNRTVEILHEALYMNNVCDQALYFNSEGSEKIEFPKDFFEDYKSSEKQKCEF